MTHTLKIISLHDAQAACTCGGWSLSATGKRTREGITEEWRKHAPYKSIKESRAEVRTLTDAAEPWTDKEAAGFRQTAIREYYRHSYQHGARRDPDNCAACALQMRPEPNYAGWLRVYIQAGVRPNTRAALKEIERAQSENERYYQAILRDIRTYCPKFIYTEGWDDNAKAEAGEKF